jgi:hypothetical protein
MGLAEQIRQGTTLSRQQVIVTTVVAGSGSFTMPPAYALLSIQSSTAPVRIRLYDTEDSLTNAGEITRPFGSRNISSSVSLVGDFQISSSITHPITPAVFSVSNGTTYYRVEPATPLTMTLVRYNLEEVTSATSNKRVLPPIQASLTALGQVSGTLADTSIPQTYLLVSASATNPVRLRLYRSDMALTDAMELARPFSTEPSASVQLIADTVFTGSVIHFVPKLVGANLQNMGDNLTPLRASKELRQGERELYYVMDNPSASPITVTASLAVYSLED